MEYQNRSGFFNNIPLVTKNLIIINCLCWMASLILPKFHVDLIQWLGLHFPGGADFYPFQLITYMFMHDTHSFGHIFFNMFAVFMFGSALENVWGPKRFLIFYLVTGAGAAVINIVVAYLRIQPLESMMSVEMMEEVYRSGGELLRSGRNYADPLMGQLNFLINTPTVGASGAVFGILLGFGMLFPNTSLYIFFVPIPIKAKYFVVIYGFIELFLGFADFNGDNVAHFAHLGGMLFGFFMIRYWKKKEQKNERYF
ncbi:MAG: rhomboid family intramembrane serine protease [Tannerella sp.]|jgi:membrane associated rhomboid family serine protease|nr:rhomboid family intramembrane serine protease [Tannerella sp.]